MPPLRGSGGFLRLNVLVISLLLALVIAKASDNAQCRLYRDTRGYVLSKLRSHDLVLLGTTHKKTPILRFISDLLPQLHEAAVTHLGLEIASDQQQRIDHYMATGFGFDDIQIPPPVDCLQYRFLLRMAQKLDQSRRPTVIALDLPLSRFGGKMSRDEWMARQIADVFRKDPNARMLAVPGTFHVLKEMRWQDHVPNKKKSVYGYLTRLAPEIEAFSIGQLIDEDPAECDFTRQFGPMDGAVALDCDERFSGWKMGIQFDIAIKPTQACDLVDGLIVY